MLILWQESIGLRLVCDRFRFQFWYVCILFILGGMIYGRNGAVIGWTEKGRVGSEVCMEVDLRSSAKEERRIRFIVNGKIQKCVIVGLGNEIRYGVCNNTHIFFLYYHCLFDLLIDLIRFHFVRVGLELDLLNIWRWNVQGRER